MYSFLNDLKKVAIQIDELCTKLQEHNHPSLPYDVSVVIEFLTTLSDKGLILFLPSSGWIVIDKAALCTEVNGVLFASSVIKRVHRDIASNTGIITLSALKDTFPHHDIDMLVGFLKSLEFCHVINTDILNSISTNISPSTPIASGELLFFPSLVNSDSPAVMSNDPKFGYCLWCPKPHEFLSNRFLHVLLLHLPLRYCLRDSAGQLESLKHRYDRLCNVWHNGILWQNDELEVLVQVSESNRCVTLLMSHKDGFEALQISSSLLREIHILRNNFCPCHIEEYIIVPSKLAKNTHLVPVSERSLIRLNDVACAVLQKEDRVRDTKGKSVSIADIVSNQEVYYCLHSSTICELFTDDHHVDEEVYDTIKGACKDIMKEYRREDPVSSLSVRNHLNMYSLFSSCELKVHVSIAIC